MTARVAVVGTTGRVGRALCVVLAERFEVLPIVRRSGEGMAGHAARSVAGADVVVNAAGVAHLAHPTPGDVQRLRVANVELPLALARASLGAGCSFIHVSSVKAADPSNPYAASKREADERLSSEFGDAFASAGASLIVVRPLALLFPPLDVGKASRLQFLHWWPKWLTPTFRLPVLTASTFIGAVESTIDGILGATAPVGFSLREFGPEERGTLQDVRDAMLAWKRMEGGS